MREKSSNKFKTNASFASNSSFAELVISLVLTLPRLAHNGSNTEVTLDVRLGLGRFLVLLVSIQPNEGTILVEFVQLQITLIFPQAIIVVIDDVFLILVVIDRIVRTSIIIPAKIKQNLFMKKSIHVIFSLVKTIHVIEINSSEVWSHCISCDSNNIWKKHK